MKSINKIEISNYLYILILLTGLIFGSAHGQSFLTNDISVVEFNSDWNKSHHFKGLEKIKNCTTFNISICENPNYMEDFSIKLPTIIVFNNGEEVKRYKSNILFTFEINYKNIQSDVDSLLLTKFN